MNCMKKLIDMDSLLIETETAAEKGRFQAAELYQQLSDACDDAYKAYSWNANRIRSDIVFDYAIKVEEKLAELRKAFDELFNQIRETKGK